MKYTYTTNGKLYLVDGAEEPREIISEFAEKVIERHTRSEAKNHWKSTGGFNIWNQQNHVSDRLMIRISSVTISPCGRFLYYLLETDAIGGLFRYDLKEEEERRIFHKEHFRASGLKHALTGEKILCSIENDDGQNIALLSNSSFDFDLITEGDSYDSAPSWVPGEDRTIVYQSSGIGRNQEGYYVGLGPSSVEKVNLDSGETETLLTSDEFDYLSPRLDDSGNLYCIRRKYKGLSAHIDYLQLLKDVVMFPIRLLSAIIGFLSLMSRIFGKEDLINAATGKKSEVNKTNVFLKGQWVDLKKRSKKDADEGVVPSDWELIKKDSNGDISVLHSRVVDFDFADEGHILHTNGTVIYKTENGQSSIVHRGKNIIESLLDLTTQALEVA